MRGILLYGIAVLLVTSADAADQETDKYSEPAATPDSPNKDSRGLFSPHMDFDEWTPLGRGDPLKNDPTYVYVPPVLERVHYWVHPSSRTPDPPLPGSMTLRQSPLERNTRPLEPILRTTHKKLSPTSTTIDKDFTREFAAEVRRDPHDPFLKFIDGPKFSSTPQHYYHHRPNNPQRNQYMLQSSYYSPPHHHHQNSASSSHQLHPQKPQQSSYDTQQSYSSELKSTQLFQQREPYTMLVPPPLQVAPTFTLVEVEMTTTVEPPTTPSPVSVEVGKGSLVYHTSTTSDWMEGKTQLATLAAASNQVTWKIATPTVETALYNQTQIVTNRPHFDRFTRVTNLTHVPSSTSTEMIPVRKYSNNVQSLDEMGPLLASLLKDESWTTSVIIPPPNIITMTTIPSLTTDPLFSHYKQPVEALRGPMYLILQGHSKVKSYGAANAQSYHGIPLQEANDISQGSEEEIDRSGREVDDGYADQDEGDETRERTTIKNVKEETRLHDCVPEEELKRSERQVKLIDGLLPKMDVTYLLDDILSQQSEGSGIATLVVNTSTDRSAKRT